MVSLSFRERFIIIFHEITAKPEKDIVLVNTDKPLLFILSYLFSYATVLTPSIIHCVYPLKVTMVSSLPHHDRGKAEKNELALT